MHKQIIILILITLSRYFEPRCLAHSLYFEVQNNGQLMIRFGEFGDDYEETPGHLDSLDAIYAWKNEADTDPVMLHPAKEQQGFKVDATGKGSVSADSGFTIMTRGSSPARKPYFYARWVPDFHTSGTPTLNLDLVPTGKPGEVRVYFRQKPLPGIKATLYTPDANDQELTSDESGLLQFKTNPEESGHYMLKVGRFREELAGFDRGTPYQLTSHNCSLTWKQ